MARRRRPPHSRLFICPRPSFAHARSLAELLEMHEQARATAGVAAPASIAVGATAGEAAALMATRKSALIVGSAGEACAGIVTPKDLLFR